MNILFPLLGLLSLLAALVSVIVLIVAAIRKKPKKKIVIFLTISFVISISMIAVSSGDA